MNNLKKNVIIVYRLGDEFMKKSLYLGAIVIGTCLLSGCGSKTLVCTRSNDYSDEMKMNQTVKTSFKNDHVSKLSIDMDVTLGENYMEYREELKTSVQDEFNDLKDTDGVKFSTVDTSNGFKFNLEANVSKLDSTSKKKLDIIDTEQSYDDAKKEFESEGYTCK